MSERTGIYPGTFDPVTNGHMDIISRAARVVDTLIVGVAINAGKSPLFSLDERVEMVANEIAVVINSDTYRVNVRSFEGLLTDFAASCGASLIVRGLRAVSDFEYEFQMTTMNRRLQPNLDTLFMMTGESSFYVSSRLVKEVVSLGGDVSTLVPARVLKKLKEKFRS